ncbi:GAK5 protein, partial [Vidua chalybeata]|nr:GAK5 protein [Vidua chalybeata]
MAAAFAAVRGPPGTSGVCFGCGKPRHFKRDCPTLKGAKPQAPDVYPRCCKGTHFANQCHSKYDSKGCPIQGNRYQSAGRWRHALTQMPQLPSQMPTPRCHHHRHPTEGLHKSSPSNRRQ